MSTFNWPSLGTAHGDASHIPEAINLLLSDDSAVRRDAYWRIDNYVVLQGDLYEAAPFTASALLKLLQENIETSSRILVYQLLYEIRNGYAPDAAEVVLQDGSRMRLRDSCRQIVGGALPEFEADLLSSDPALRKEAIDLVTSLDDRVGEAAAALRRAKSSTQDPQIAAELDRGIGELLSS